MSHYFKGVCRDEATPEDLVAVFVGRSPDAPHHYFASELPKVISDTTSLLGPDNNLTLSYRLGLATLEMAVIQLAAGSKNLADFPLVRAAFPDASASCETARSLRSSFDIAGRSSSAAAKPPRPQDNAGNSSARNETAHCLTPL